MKRSEHPPSLSGLLQQWFLAAGAAVIAWAFAWGPLSSEVADSGIARLILQFAPILAPIAAANAIFWTYVVVRRQPHVIDEAGISLPAGRTLRPRRIDWRDVTGVEMYQRSKQRSLRLHQGNDHHDIRTGLLADANAFVEDAHRRWTESKES